MALADQATIDAGTSAEALMERAGRAVARAAVAIVGGHYGKSALVICGKGNNGGDGFVAARILAIDGWRVVCMMTFDEAEISGAAATHLNKMKGAGVRAEPFDAEGVAGYDVYIDAIFGTGFSGEPRGVAAGAISALNGCEPVVSVDIPSGVDGATGAVSVDAVDADVTVALGATKVGVILPPGSLRAGRVEVAPIGIATDGDFGDGPRIEMAEAADIALFLSERGAESHKRSNGSVAILAGSDAIRGAALLSATGALRAGAGYVTLGTTRTVKNSVSEHPELLVVEVTDRDVLGPDVLEAFSEAIDRADALAVGPGIGTGDPQRDLVERVLLEIEIPVILDADALNVLASHTSTLEKREAPVVITPHPAELARLLGAETKDVVAHRLAAAREASRRFPTAVVLAKGHRTAIVWNAGKQVVIIPTGGPELATAGTGDVLTGALAACLARTSEAALAAISAAYIHGLAGTLAGNEIGPEGVVAGDVATRLPAALASVRTLS